MMSQTANFSTIADFYKDKSVLVTGGTGLCGKVIIWKLITSCPDIKNVYVLIREKKGSSVQERLAHLLTTRRDLFKHCNHEKQLEKIVALGGDTGQPRLGLSDQDMQTVVNHVSIIFHSAADLTFQTDLK